jgi:hypothetical protein
LPSPEHLPLDLGTARFEALRVERQADLPPRDENAIEVAVIDLNADYPNIGHDAIVTLIRDATLALDDELARRGATVRVLSYAVRDKLMVPDHRARPHGLYVGTGGPGHLDPRRNVAARGTVEILEDPAWERAVWQLFDDIAADEASALYGVCHTFGLLCRWSQVAEPVLRGPGKGGPMSGVGTNVLTDQALAHPWFGRLAAESPGGRLIPVLDSRYYDLIPSSRALPAGMAAIAYEESGDGEAGEALTMLEIAREPSGAPRMFAVNSHPEIGAADRVAGLLERLLARGTITPEIYAERTQLLPALRSERSDERLRVGRFVFGDLVTRKLERLVRAAA